MFVFPRKHEYEKHGTCSASLHGFETEHDYFEQGLALSHKHDVQRWIFLMCIEYSCFSRAI